MDTVDMIADEGFSVVEVSSADEAFAFLAKHSSLQLLFTDVQTPGDLNGFDLAREVAERWPHIFVVVASGAVTPGPGDLPENARFISKPLSAALVHQVLRDHYIASASPGSTGSFSVKGSQSSMVLQVDGRSCETVQIPARRS